MRTGLFRTPTRVLCARDHDRGAAVGCCADVQEAQGIGDHRRGEHLIGGEPLSIPRIWILGAVCGVLDLDRREVLLRCAVQIHPAARVEREIGRVGDPDVKADPVGVLGPIALGRRKKALGCRVGAHHQRDFALARKDLRARRGQRLRARGAGGVRGVDLRALPAERLREGGARNVTRVAAAHRRRARHVLHVPPADSGVGERGTRRVHAILDEVASPLAPGVHTHAQDDDLAAHRELSTGFHFQINFSVSPSR